MRGVFIVQLAMLVVCARGQTITTRATFNNVGIVVDLGAATTQSVVRVFVKASGTPTNTYRENHPLSRLSATRFAGSVFGLKSASGYDFKLTSGAFGSDQLVPVMTRSELFPDATNRVYHVSPISGNDTNDGSSLGAAFRTLAKAISVANSGAKILLHNGTYYEGDLAAPRSGTAGAPIVIENAPGERPILNGADASFTPSWSVHDVSAHVYKAPCTVIPQNAYLNGGQFFHYPDLASLLNSPWVQPGGYFTDGTYLYARFPDNGAPGTNVVTLPARTTCLTLDGISNWQVRGIEFCFYGLDEFHRAIYINNGNSNVIDGCFFRQNGIGVALKRSSDFNTIQNCVFTEFPISTWSWHAVKDSGSDYEAGGVVIYGSDQTNRGNVIRSCLFTNMFDGSHLYSDNALGPTENLDFYNNVVEHCVDDGIETDGAGSNCRIYFNRFVDFLTGISVAPAAPGPTYIFRNVLAGWRNSEEFSGYPFKFNVSSGIPIQWVYLYHNTCYTTVAGQNGFWFKQYSAWTNIVSRNNIFAGTAYALENDSGAVNTESFDYDDVFTSKLPPAVIRWNGVSYNSLAAFSAATGQEPHGRTNQPVFLNPGADDYYLPANSPLIDKGVALPGINDDWLGAGPDLGALEHGMEAKNLSINTNGTTTSWLVGTSGKYQLEFRTNLLQPTWTVVGSAMQAQIPNLELLDPAAPGAQRFYRLRHVSP